jgi:hypothetical protein
LSRIARAATALLCIGATVLACVGIAFLSAGCGVQLGWPEDCASWGTCDPVKTCSGAARSDTAMPYQYVFEEQVWGCLLSGTSGSTLTWTGWANSATEAESCALRSVGDPNGALVVTRDVSQVEMRYFVVLDYTYCVPGCATRPSCQQVAKPTVSAASATSCVEKDWFSSTGDVRIIDVTDEVRLPGGGVDYGAWNAACPICCPS